MVLNKLSIRETKRLSNNRTKLIEYLNNSGIYVSEFERESNINKLIKLHKPYKNILRNAR